MEIQAIKAHLKTIGMTYETLSERSGIPLNTLKNIFRGKTKNPRIDTMQAIEDALGLSPTQLTEEDKTLGIIPEYKEVLAPDEVELLDAYRAIKGEKGEQAAHAMKTLMKAYLNEKNKPTAICHRLIR